jgi:hypothetical protein
VPLPGSAIPLSALRPSRMGGMALWARVCRWMGIEKPTRTKVSLSARCRQARMTSSLSHLVALSLRNDFTLNLKSVPVTRSVSEAIELSTCSQKASTSTHLLEPGAETSKPSPPGRHGTGLGSSCLSPGAVSSGLRGVSRRLSCLAGL